MRKLLVFALALFLATLPLFSQGIGGKGGVGGKGGFGGGASSGGGITVIQTASAASRPANSPVTITGLTLTAGHQVFVMVEGESGAASDFTVTDNAATPNTYVQGGSGADWNCSAAGYCLSVFVSTITTGGSGLTISCADSHGGGNSIYPYCTMIDVTGSNGIDAYATALTYTLSVTTSRAGDILVTSGNEIWSQAGTTGGPAGYTDFTGDPYEQSFYLTGAPSGSNTVTWGDTGMSIIQVIAILPS